MRRRLPNGIAAQFPPIVFMAALVGLWQIAAGFLPPFMLPSPARVALTLMSEFPLLLEHLGITLFEAAVGLAFSIAAAFLLALIMDTHIVFRQAVLPILTLSQTVPVIAIAPLLVLWMGYGIAPKIAVIFLTCFFPMTIALLDGLSSADTDALHLLQSMGATRRQLYRYIKLPSALPAFFSGLKISSAYAIVGAVISEWLGGNSGLGVYMTRVRRSYSIDKMFAVIVLIAALSLVLMKLVAFLERRAMPWRNGKTG